MEHRRRLALCTAAVSVALLAAAGCGTGNDGGKTLVQPAGGSAAAGDGEAGGEYGSGDPGSDGYGSGPGSGSGSGYGSGAADSADSQDAAARRTPAQQLGVRDVAGVGPAVTDSRGFTLYRFDKDTAVPSAATCEGACATTWPPVPADDATAGALIDPQLLGEVVRGDGTRQLTLAGWPVYRYRMDVRPGQANGEGVGGTWHALGPDGKPAAAAAKPAPAPDATPGAGAGSATGGSSQPPVSNEQLTARQDPALGTVLVDGAGRTLYRFDKDSAWPMKTRCTGACLDMWKPAKPVDRTRVRGVDPRLVNTFTRPDGSRQLAVDCWILYTYTGDTKPGDVNGQGKGGVWWAVKETGKKAGK
ncbi:SCO0930 family lipoprotein [Streptomyces sp. 12297]